MFKKQNKNNAAKCRKMTSDEQNRFKQITSKKSGNKKIISTQQTLPYVAMFPDGICQLSRTQYSKSILFEDTNYMLEDAENKSDLFDKWCDLINYFDSSVSVQFTYIHHKRRGDYSNTVFRIAEKKDTFNSVRNEYTTMLKKQYLHAGNGMIHRRIITFTIHSERYKAAKTRLERIESL